MRIIHYFSPMSGYAYLGFGALQEMARRHRTEVEHRPMDIARVFAAIETIAPARQSSARLAWRRSDMARWADRRNLPLKQIPRYWPIDATLASCAIIAARDTPVLQEQLIRSLLSAVWAQDGNIADYDTVEMLVNACGLDVATVLGPEALAEASDIYQSNTQAAIGSGVVGSPTYFVGASMTFGQDRFDFVEQDLIELMSAQDITV